MVVRLIVGANKPSLKTVQALKLASLTQEKVWNWMFIEDCCSGHRLRDQFYCYKIIRAVFRSNIRGSVINMISEHHYSLEEWY